MGGLNDSELTKKKFEDLDADKQYEHILNTILSKQKRAINFTKHYRLKNTLKDKAFNIRFNKTDDLRELFDKKHDYSEEFWAALRYQIKNTDHIILVFFGPTNSGKSWGAIAISFIIQKIFKEELENDSKILLSFSDPEYQKKLPDMIEKDIMIRDETPNISGTGAQTLQKNIKNVVSITRAGQYCFLFVSPDVAVKKTKTVSFYLESAGICKEKEKTRFILYDEDMVPLGRIFVDKPTDEKFLKEYEIKKKKNIKKMIKDAGQTGISPDMKKLHKQIDMLAKFCSERGARFKGEIKSLIDHFNEKNPDSQIIGIGDYINNMVNSVFLKLKNRTKKKKGDKSEIKLNSEIYYEMDDFQFDQTDLYELIKEKVNWRDKELYIEIYEKIRSGFSQKELEKEYGYRGGTISNIKLKVDGAIKQFRGKMFEEQVKEYMEKRYEDKPNIIFKYDGGNGKPDMYLYDKKKIELIVLSLKCLNLPDLAKDYPVYINWKSSQKDKLDEGFIPEIKYAGENLEGFKNVLVFAVICNANNTGNVKTFPFDFQHKHMIKIESEF